MATDRIRGRALQAIRRRHFQLHPLCVECLRKKPPRTEEATELDHVVALVNGGEDVEENRQGLCGPCHEAKTARDMGYKIRKQIGLDGYPIE